MLRGRFREPNSAANLLTEAMELRSSSSTSTSTPPQISAWMASSSGPPSPARRCVAQRSRRWVQSPCRCVAPLRWVQDLVGGFIDSIHRRNHDKRRRSLQPPTSSSLETEGKFFIII